MRACPSTGMALIAGALRAIGAVDADRLARRGDDRILVARTEARCKERSARLTQETGRSVTPRRADRSDKADRAQVESLLRDDQAITMLVNNVGLGSVAPLLDADVEHGVRLQAVLPVGSCRAGPDGGWAKSQGMRAHGGCAEGVWDVPHGCERMLLQHRFRCGQASRTHRGGQTNERHIHSSGSLGTRQASRRGTARP